jgi:uncharacterized protein (TIGR03086 family)
MDPIDALELSWNQGKAVIAQLSPDLLGKPSECEAWDIRATLNHTLNVCQMMTRVNQGHPPEADESVDLVGDGTGLMQVWEEFGRENVASWRESELVGERAYRWAAFPAPVAAAINLGEVVVHGWDVAQAIGVDFPIQPELAELVYAVYSAAPLDGMREMGELGPEIPVSPEAPVTERLLGLLGRAV